MWAAHKLKIISIALTVSLLANIGMVGMVAGNKAAKWAWHPRQSLGNIARIAKQLPEEQKAEIHEMLKSYGGRMRESGEAIRKQREYIRDLVSKEILDKTALAKALEELRSLTGGTQALGHEMILTVIDKVPASQRAKLFERGKGAGLGRDKKDSRHEP